MSFPWNGHLQVKESMSYKRKQNALSETRDMNRVTYHALRKKAHVRDRICPNTDGPVWSVR